MKASAINRIRKTDMLVFATNDLQNALPEIRRDEWFKACQIVREIAIQNQLHVEQDLNIEDDT